jgi:hypothetical protein
MSAGDASCRSVTLPQGGGVVCGPADHGRRKGEWIMSDGIQFLALNTEGDPQWFGYKKGVGHLVWSEVVRPGGNHIGGADATMPTACPASALETRRVVAKYAGDRLCKRCETWLAGDGQAAVSAAHDAAHAEASGPSVADTLLDDPETVVITLDTVLAETDTSNQETPTAPVTAAVTGPTTRNGVKDLPEPRQPSKPVKRARKPLADPVVRCEPGAPGEDMGDGTGVCRSCGWRGPVKAVSEPCTREDHSECAHSCECACKHKRPHKDMAECKHLNACKHKKITRVVMVNHNRNGVNPPPATMSEDYSEHDLPLSPATVDKGRKGADDVRGGAAAGMYRGRTSITRGRDMTGAQPQERGEGQGPVPTTMDTPLGGNRLDVTATKHIETTDTGVKVVDWTVGGRHGYLTQEEYNALSRTQQRRYRRHIKTNEHRASRAAKQAADKAARLARRAEKDAGRRLAEAMIAGNA